MQQVNSYKDQIAALLAKSIRNLGITDIIPQVTVPEKSENGDYATNVCLVLAGRIKQKPLDLAEKIVEDIRRDQTESINRFIKDIKIASPGFLNVFINEADFISQINGLLKDRRNVPEVKKPIPQALKKTPKTAGKQEKHAEAKKIDFEADINRANAANGEKPRLENAKRVMVEFAHPNTHKAFHIGHLRNITTGESVIRLLEAIDIEVIRANYQGDVGMHIAKALYGIKHRSPSFKLAAFFDFWKDKGIKEKVEFLGGAYAFGSQAYEKGGEPEESIKDYNYLIYASVQRFNKERGIEPSSTDYMKFVHGRGSEVDEIYELWKETRSWSLEYFQSIYKRLGTRYDRLYFESENLAGVDMAREAVRKGILTESDGAVIFDGKPYGLDTRVFVNNLGLPTYEGKELSLSKTQFTEHGHIDHLIHVLGPEQVSFTQVTFKVEELLGIQKNQQFHLVYGWVKLKHGKMSSRTGNVVLGEWLIDEAKKEIHTILDASRTTYADGEKERIAEKAAIAAVKYSFLRVGTKQEIAFDLSESINFNGDSGPYIQYTYARCRSVLRKTIQTEDNDNDDYSKYVIDAVESIRNISKEERLLLRSLVNFNSVVFEAAVNLTPNILCTYLYSLASEYNNLYAKQEILGNELRLALTAATAKTIGRGLYLLGIETLERM